MTSDVYRDGAGVVLLNGRGLAWSGRRVNPNNLSPRMVSFPWQMPQGGIESGESPLEAARRELSEETGAVSADFLAESSWMRYELPLELRGVALGGGYRGQRLKWFAFRFVGDDDEFDLSVDVPEFDSWRWTPLSRIAVEAVDFKRLMYGRVVAAFRRFAK